MLKLKVLIRFNRQKISLKSLYLVIIRSITHKHEGNTKVKFRKNIHVGWETNWKVGSESGKNPAGSTTTLVYLGPDNWFKALTSSAGCRQRWGWVCGRPPARSWAWPNRSGRWSCPAGCTPSAGTGYPAHHTEHITDCWSCNAGCTPSAGTGYPAHHRTHYSCTHVVLYSLSVLHF